MDAAPKNACKDAAEQLALCIEKSPCVARGGSIVECLQREIGDCEVRARCVGARRAARAPGRVPAAAHLLPVDAPTPSFTRPQKYRTGYFLCRRQQLDMRTRIRGKKFVDGKDAE